MTDDSVSEAPLIGPLNSSEGEEQTAISEETGRYIDDVLADLVAARAMLNDARPLEALAAINDTIDRLEEERSDE